MFSIDPAFLLFLGIVVLGIVLWRMISTVQGVTDHSFRRREYERRDYLNLVERLIEKRDCEGEAKIGIAQLHAQERNNKNRMDTEVEVKVAGEIVAEKPIFSTSDPEGDLLKSVHA